MKYKLYKNMYRYNFEVYYSVNKLSLQYTDEEIFNDIKTQFEDHKSQYFANRISKVSLDAIKTFEKIALCKTFDSDITFFKNDVIKYYDKFANKDKEYTISNIKKDIMRNIVEIYVKCNDDEIINAKEKEKMETRVENINQMISEYNSALDILDALENKSPKNNNDFWDIPTAFPTITLNPVNNTF